MGELVVVEGLDGSGKRTLTAALSLALAARGASVTCRAFPRYGASVEAELLAEALHGRAGDLGDSVHGMAALFALDRGGARADLIAALATHDVVLLDRYTASNAAFGAARLHEAAGGDFVAWVRELEFGRLGLPVPAVQLLLRVPVALAQHRAAGRETADPERTRDAFELDHGLQERTGTVYDALAAAAWVSPWRVLEGTVNADALAGDLLG